MHMQRMINAAHTSSTPAVTSMVVVLASTSGAWCGTGAGCGGPGGAGGGGGGAGGAGGAGGGSTGHCARLLLAPMAGAATGVRLRPTSKLPFAMEPLMHFDRLPMKLLYGAFPVPLWISRTVQSNPKNADRTVPSKRTDMLSASRALAL